jgi:hypothetical protein
MSALAKTRRRVRHRPIESGEVHAAYVMEDKTLLENLRANASRQELMAAVMAGQISPEEAAKIDVGKSEPRTRTFKDVILAFFDPHWREVDAR